MFAGKKPEKSVSVAVIIISGILLSILSLVLFLALHFITDHFSPSYKNAERFLHEGKVDEAFAVSAKIHGHSAKKMLLRGKLFLARSLKQRKKNRWENYGTNEEDWLTGKDIDSALSSFKTAYHLDDNNLTALYFTAVVYKEKGWFEEAEEVLQEVVRRDRQYVDAHIALGSLYTTEEKPVKAAEHLYYADEITPHNPLIAKNIAFLYRFYLKKPDSAIVWLHRYLNIAAKGDIDIQYAKHELHDLEARYPEFAVKDPQPWQKKERIFVPRNYQDK
jgi:hypothetical protein